MSSSKFETRKIPRELYYLSILLLGVLLSYSDALSNGFAYDDVPIVEKNRLIRSWSNLPEIFTTGYWESIGGTGGLYRPLTITSYLAEFSISGIHPLLYHANNILLHLICCIIIYLLIKKISGDEFGAFAGSLVFGMHAVHVEAVANIVGRAELLSTLFLLLALYVFVARPRRLPWRIVSPILMFLGLLSKETAIVLPALIFVYLLLFERDDRGRDIRSIVLALAPYVLTAAAFMAVRLLVLGGEVYPHGLDQALVFTKPVWRVIVMLKVFVAYLRLALFPTDLQVHYMLRPPESVLDPYMLVLAAVTAGFVFISPRLIRTKPWYFFFIVWFPVGLLPVSNLIPTGILMTERSMYLPTIGTCALIGFAFSRAAGCPEMKNMRVAAVSFAALLVAVTTLGVLTHQRNHVWHDTVTIDKALVRSYTRVTENFPESGLYYTHLAYAYQGLHMDEEALAALIQAVKVEPNTFNYVKLAKFYRDTGRYELALEAADKAASHSEDPGSLDYGDTADALMAEIYYMNGMYDKSRTFTEKVLSSEIPRSAENYGKIAMYLYNIGLVDKAEELLKKSMSINPYFASAHMNYGILLYEEGNLDSAFKEFIIAAELDPSLPQPFFEMGLIHGQRMEFEEALEDMKTAVELAPENAEYRYFLAAAYIGVGDTNMAVDELRQSLSLNPDYAKAADLLSTLQ